MKLYSIILCWVAFTASFSMDSAKAAEVPADPHVDTMLGDMGGLRTALDQKGLMLDLNYEANVWRAASGGIKHGNAYVGMGTFTVSMDNNKLLGIPGNTASLQLMNTHGGKPNSYVGSIQGVDNLEVRTPNTLLYEAWMQQNFMDDRISTLVGLRDLNAEFVDMDMATNFAMPAMEIGQEFAQAGRNGPSIYPVTALAARLQVKPTATSYLKLAVFDGVAGDPNHPHGTQVALSNTDGELLIAEVGITPGNLADGPVNNKFAVGAWTYTKQFADIVEVDGAGDPILRKSSGIYALASYSLYHDATERSIGGFFRIGATNGDVSQTAWAYEAGVVGRGWVAGRTDAEIGVGVSQATNSSPYIAAAGDGTKRRETGFELYCRDTIAPGIALQPDLQYVMNPGATAGTDHAMLVGLHMDINF